MKKPDDNYLCTHCGSNKSTAYLAGRYLRLAKTEYDKDKQKQIFIAKCVPSCIVTISNYHVGGNEILQSLGNYN